MSDNCKQSFIPETDNTPLLCSTYLADRCVIIPEGNAFLGTNDNDDLNEYNVKLIEKLIAQDQRVITLEAANPGTITYNLTLTGTLLNFIVNGTTVDSVDLQSLTSAGLTETKEVFTASDGQVTLTLNNIVNMTVPNQVIVEGTFLLEGIGNDYTISGNTITFSDPMEAGDIIQVLYKY